MNEQILTKLVIQSSDKDGWLDREKFAELIVKECAEQCTTDGPFVAEVVWGKQFHKKILEHFGVE